jgi:ribosome-associated protein
MIQITTSRQLDENEIYFEYLKSSGPGGQNINKVSSAVRLRFDIHSTSFLSAEEKIRLFRIGGKRLTDDGVLIIEAKNYRTQEKNRKDATRRLINLLSAAIDIPKTRLKTRPSLRARATRRLDKKKRGELKRIRKFTLDDW